MVKIGKVLKLKLICISKDQFSHQSLYSIKTTANFLTFKQTYFNKRKKFSVNFIKFKLMTNDKKCKLLWEGDMRYADSSIGDTVRLLMNKKM